MTGTYAVIGDPIDHSLSPLMHNAAFRELGMECTYIAYRIPAGELEDGIGSLRDTGVMGFNVTIPHKVDVLKYADEQDEDCRAAGAANTISNEGGKLAAHNTDIGGFLDPLMERKIKCRGASALLLGAGGAARAAAAALAKEGASITVANRDIARAKSLAELALSLGADSRAAALSEAPALAKGADYIINATSLGMRGEPSPIPKESISPECTVYDMVYRPVSTGLISEAKKAGASIIYGYEMLLGQAYRSFEIWHKRQAPRDAMKRVLLGGF